jgi:O-antigen/teichoic acid export membrane protein
VIKIISIIITPTIIVIFLFGNYILLAFGKKYSHEEFIPLKLLSISGIFISINAIRGAILNIKHKIILLTLLSLITTAVILSLSVILIKMNLFGIIGVGIGWIVGQGTTSLIYLFLIVLSSSSVYTLT